MKKIFLYLLIQSILFFHSVHTYASQAVSTSVFTVVSQNLNRFVDNKDDGNNEKILSAKKYQRRINQLLDKISREYQFADVIAFQEVENKAILQHVGNLLKNKYDISYQSILIEGNDISGIDVGFLVKKKYRIEAIRSLFQQKTYSHREEKLFSRPPLLIKLCLTECLTIVNVHLRSMRGLNSSRHRKRVSLKRRLQAETLARWVDKFQHQNSTEKLIIAGDFNALSPSDDYTDSLGTIMGKPDQQRPTWKSPDLIQNDLIDISQRVGINRRYSYKYKRKRQQLDYLLVSNNLKNKIKSVSFSRIDYRFSDHAAIKAKILLH